MALFFLALGAISYLSGFAFQNPFFISLSVLFVVLGAVQGIAKLIRGNQPPAVLLTMPPEKKRSLILWIISLPFRWMGNLFSGLFFLALVYGFLSGAPLLIRGSSGPNMVEWVASYMTTSWQRPDLLPEAQLALAPFSPLLQQDDEDRLRRLFPNDREFEEVLSWGERVFLAWQYTFRAVQADYRYPPDSKIVAQNVLNVPLTRALKAHAAWRKLTDVPGCQHADLARLEEIIAQAEPNPQQRALLITWAEQRRNQPRPSPLVGTTSTIVVADGAIHPPVPNSRFFTLWTIYSEWCPTEALLAGRLQAIRNSIDAPNSRFMRSTDEAIVSWGMQLAEERISRNEVFPALSRRTAVLAANDRLTGRERPKVPPGEPFEYIVRADTNIATDLPQTKATVTFTRVLRVMSFFIVFPNDDITALMFTGGWKPELFTPKIIDSPVPIKTPRDQAEEWGYTLAACIGTLILGLFLAHGMRIITLMLFGWVLGMRTDPIRLSYVEGIRRRSKRFRSGFLVFLIAGIATSQLMEPFFVLYIPNIPRLIMIVFWSTLVGGVLVEGLRNLITVLFIKAGLDPRHMIADDLIAAIVSVGMLWLFQNSWIAIIASVALGLIPGLLYKLRLANSGEA